MAITVISSPNQISSAFNQMLYLISSNNTTQPNFNFVADVYVSGYVNASGDAIQARLRYPVQPNSTQLQFDIGNVIKNYVQHDFIDSFGTLIQANWRSTANYYVQFGEVYDVSGVPTLYQNLTRNPTSGYKQGINSIFDFQQFTTNILDTYDVSNGKFLNTSYKQYYKASEQKLLTFLDKNRIIDNWIISFKDSSGSEFDTQTGLITLPTNNIKFNLDLKSMFYAPIPNGTVYFTVDLNSSATLKASYRIDIYNECTQFETYKLHWLNQLGGFDTFTFNKGSVISEDIQRKQFKSIQKLGNAISDRLKTNYVTEIIDKINLQSDWVTDDEAMLLQSLAESSIVYLENSDGSFVSVNISDTNYETKKWVKGRQIFNVSMNMEYTYNRYRQSV